MLAEIQPPTSKRNKTAIFNPSEFDHRPSGSTFLNQRIQEWVNDLRFWRVEATTYVELLEINQKEEPSLTLLHRFIQVNIPELLQTLQKLEKQKEGFDRGDFEQVARIYHRLKRQFREIKLVILDTVVETYPVIFI